MINLAAQYPGKTGTPSASYPYGSAQNITTPGDGTGTPWEQALANDLVGWMQAMVNEATITPSGSPETVLASDCMDALFAILQSVRNPFANYALFKHEETSGTGGGTITASTWNVRPLSQFVNNISGASIAANQITLPAGDYRVTARAQAINVDRHKLALYDTTGTSFLVLGLNADARGSSTGSSSTLVGEFTLSTTSILELQHYSTETQATTGMGQPLSTGQNEAYASLEIWKLD